MRYFITKDTGEQFGRFLEVGWIYYHDSATHGETESTIELGADYPTPSLSELPKGSLVEISQFDYESVENLINTGDDASAVIDKLISREGDGFIDKPPSNEQNQTGF